MAAELVKRLLLRIVSDMDSGSSTLTEEEEAQVIRALRRYTRKDVRLSKAQCCERLGVSRATFDRMVRDGRMPKGRKTAGFKELSWSRGDLDKAIKGMER